MMKQKVTRFFFLTFGLLTVLSGISHAQEFCWKNSYGRGVGTVPKLTTYFKGFGQCGSGYRDKGLFCAKSECTGGKEYDAGLCYKPCRTGYNGRGPVCWTPAPTSWVECGMGAGKTSVICAGVTTGQVVSAISLATKPFSAAGSGAQSASSASRLASLRQRLAEVKALYEAHKTQIKVATTAYTAASAANNTHKLIEQETVTEEDIVRLEMQILSLVDPTGVASVMAAYTYPTCDQYFPNGDARTDYTVYNDPHTTWVPWAYRSDKSQPPGAFIGGWEGNRPLRICRGQYAGASGALRHVWHPGKIYDGKCNFTWGGTRKVVSNYETMVNRVPLIWVPSSHEMSQGGMRQPRNAIIAAYENERPLRICKALYNGVKHPGKIYEGRCEIPYGSRIERLNEYDVLIPEPTSLPAGFEECANEGGTCYFTGTISAFYGDGNSKWQIVPKKASFTCNAQNFGRDPAPNVAKACYIPANSMDVLPYNYVECAKDNGSCTTKAVTDGGDSYYGDGQRWRQKPVTGGTFACSSAYFGGDPAPGAMKSCYIPDYAITARPANAVLCANDGEVCTVQGTGDIYYGAGSNWKVRTITDSTACIASVFNDGGTGQGKACYSLLPASGVEPSVTDAGDLLSWISSTGTVPANAVIGGQETGRQLPVCRASYQDGVHPGKVVAGKCNFGWGGNEIVLTTFEVLTNNGADLAWTPGPSAPGMVIGGQANGHQLPICRASHQGGVHPGKVYAGKCNIGWGGREIVLSNHPPAKPGAFNL